MKCLFIILDGLGDRGISDWNQNTPLQKAHTPTLDYLASVGANGSLTALCKGAPLPSEIAHFLIFGYAIEDFPGRGVIEALGYDFEVSFDEVYVLVKLLSVKEIDDTLYLAEEKPPADEETIMSLIDDIRYFRHKGIEVEFKPTHGIDGILKLSGNVSSQISDSNPIFNGRPLLQIEPLKGAENLDAANQTAEVLNKYILWAHLKLASNPLNSKRKDLSLPPINAAATQRAGKLKKIKSFEKKWKLRSEAFVSSALYTGIGKIFDMKVHKFNIKDPYEDLLAKLKQAVESEKDFSFVHTKAPDVAAHTRIPENKVKVIEALDSALGKILPELDFNETLLVITADHSTPSVGDMIHSGESVPLLMVGKYLRRDKVVNFDEISCLYGSLGEVRGNEIMPMILNFMDRADLYGLQYGQYPLRMSRDKSLG